jgi:hypothetical protein
MATAPILSGFGFTFVFTLRLKVDPFV